MISVKGICKSFDGTRALDDVNFDVGKGAFYGIIGPNGSGKSTLLRLISGVEKPDAGEVQLDGHTVGSYGRKELAQWLAVLQQDAIPAVGFTVREVVEMGRYPFQNWLGEEDRDSSAIIDGILEKMGLTGLQDRTLLHLSGGERQRVALAKTMAQEPRLLLLDEPTTFLDIGFQVQMMDAVKQWRAEKELTVVAVLHDLNLAAQYCDRLLLLQGGKVVAAGTPEQIIEESLIEHVYGTEPIVLPHPENGLPQILLRPGN